MGEYTLGIERINIELSLRNKISWRTNEAFFRRGNLPLGKTDDADMLGADTLQEHVERALAVVRGVRARSGSSGRTGSMWCRPTAAAASSSSCGTTACARAGRRRSASPLRDIFTGSVFAPVLEQCSAIHQRVLRGRVWVALHMHAGRRQRPHQHPGQQRRLRDAADRARGGRPHHGAGAQPRRRDLGRARHRHHQARVPDRRGTRALRRLQAEGRPARPLQQGQAAARRCAVQCARPAPRRPQHGLHAELRPDGLRVADHAAERHRRHRRLGQELPALRQVQAGLLDPCAARQPAVFAAQQDPRDFAAGRGLPLRGADPARHQHQALGGVRGRGRPLHGLSQVPVALSGQDRLRRCVDEHAQPAAQDGAEELPARQRGRDVHAQRDQPETIKLARSAMVGVGFKAQRLANTVLGSVARKQTSAPPASVGTAGSRSR